LFDVNLDVPFTKTRQNQSKNQEKQKKYYRYPKIYQNKYVDRLGLEELIIALHSKIDPEDEKFEILCLFFREHTQICLLVGRVEKEASDDE